jgi:uncharacterized membrane protein
MRFWNRYPHFIAFIAVLLAGSAALMAVTTPARALLGGFDAGSLLFLLLLGRRFADGTPASMRRRAAANEPDHATLTSVALVVVAVVTTAVGVELSGGPAHDGGAVGLAALTLLLAWAFANSLFALHYAHVYYLGGTDAPGKPRKDRGGLDFPGGEATPDYWDFTYFAFVLGMTFQVSDVVITARPMRRLALVHALLAFVFNIAVVALSVNLVAAAIG